MWYPTAELDCSIEGDNPGSPKVCDGGPRRDRAADPARKTRWPSGFLSGNGCQNNQERPRFLPDFCNGADALILTSGGHARQVRLRYTFHDHRLVATLVPPIDARAEYEVWLGDFDVLGAPRLHPAGTERKGKEAAVVSKGVFYPHPHNRQGLLLTFPEKRPVCSRGDAVHFSLRANQDVVLRFVEEKDVPEALKQTAPTKAAPPVPGKADKKESP